MISPYLVGLLAIRQQRLNERVGIKRITPQVAGLLLLYQHQVRQATSRYAQACFLRAVIEARRLEMAEIIAKARAGAPGAKLLHRAQVLEADIMQAVTALEKLESDG